jgi:hypothetical protein
LVYGLICCVLFAQLVRSVVGDLYGRRASDASQETPAACLDDVQRLYDQLSARAVQPAPRGLESGKLSEEWDQWARRWEDEVARVSLACRLDVPENAVMQSLGEALDGIEDLRRRLSRTGEDAAENARRVKESLDAAREKLKLH